MRGATRLHNCDCVSLIVSIHAPRAGCDGETGARGATGAVSIHAPRAGCDPLRIVRVLLSDVSIHAPRAGCDVLVCKKASQCGCFNSRTPCGVRLDIIHVLTTNTQFQFTHPVRGATQKRPRYQQQAVVSIHAPRAGCDVSLGDYISSNRVSIHAPRAGCDSFCLFFFCLSMSFNSRTPCGVRHCNTWHPLPNTTVSIHAPRAGCDR